MASPEPVTLFISRRVKPGFEQDIEVWAQGIRGACSKFPGYLGSQALEAHGSDASKTYDVIVHFDSVESLVAWEESEERASWYEKLKPLIEDQRTSRLQGFEPWFPPPRSQGGPHAPSKWKMWLVTFLCVYPLVNLVLYASAPFLPMDEPLWMRLLITVPLVSFLMAFYVMPFLSRVFAKWLYPSLD